ncbi:MAG TPA: class A beta-lactamase-related serine hydrolase [Anaerolineae bacterium]|nr:class A beta-lactamase-related serine hydrolase [Anaerolineae bacterium]
MKNIIIPFLLLAAMALAACGGATETPTAVPAKPTSVPEPTDEPSETAAALPADLTTALDAFLQSQVYTEGGFPETAAPGLVLLVDTPDGRYLQAAGAANLDDGTPMQPDDRLEIGSNSKSFAIALLLQLQEEGALSLDDPLSKWLPDQAAILPNGDQMTLRQLAQHTAGIWDYGDAVIGAGTTDPDKLTQAYTPEELVQFAIDNGAPDFAPGDEGMWKYSNTGYILLGMVLEAAAGETLADLYQTRIFDPLGLESAALIEGVPQGEIDTRGYWWTADGERMDTTDWNASQGWAAGALAMTAADLAKYGKALAAGELFQNPDSLAEMLTFFPDAAPAPYGLGLMDFGNGYFGHEGQTAGFQSLWFTNPDTGITVVGLTNSAAYNAFSFLELLPLFTGEPGTLQPGIWQWEQFLSPAGETTFDDAEAIKILIGFFGGPESVATGSEECGSIGGTHSIDGRGGISFELDASANTCDADAPVTQLVQYLNDAARYHFDNGRLFIELPADAGTLVFKPSSFGE